MIERQVNAVPEIFAPGTFNEIKQRLKNWLAGQDEFKDYDFTGSRINVLLDLLAYNSLFIQQFSNTAVYESFIKTASLRSSVIQHAQDNSYLPDSKSSATAGLMLKVSHALNPTSIRIPRGTKFLAYARDTSADPYPFVVTEDVVAVKDTNNQYVPIVSVAQGRIIRTQKIFDRTEQIIIRDDNIDRNTIKVHVDDVEWVNWTRKSVVHAGSTSSIFYLREMLDGSTEIYFGEGEAEYSTSDGSLQSNYIGGLKPTKGAVIVIEYITTIGEAANGATGFTYADTLQYITIDDVIENYAADEDYIGAGGGGDAESTERIREMAGLKRESQMRCVTTSDYDAFVSERFGTIVQSVKTFHDNEKPGYAFIAIKPKSGLTLTAVQREDIEDYLSDYNLGPITPVVQSPDYLFVRSKITVTYSLNKLQESEQWLNSEIIKQIDNYYLKEVEIFNTSFAKSKMLNYIDKTDHSIIGSSAELELVREIDNYFSSPEKGIQFQNEVVMGSIYSSEILFTSSKTEEETYPVHIATTTADESLKGKVLLGPFAYGDITESEHIKPYPGDDFKREVSDKRSLYYVVGEINYYGDSVYWNFASIGLETSDFLAQSIELNATPDQDNIFVRNGSMIVFENELRPEYTDIILEGITA